jgi:hypothetical protein
MTHITRFAVILATGAGLVGASLAAAPAGAIVPPKDCKIITVGGKRYNIKSDQLKCKTARQYSATYLRTHHKPSGYVCNRYTGSKIVFRCVAAKYNPDRTFFAIKK